jgi:hypothetical protein
MEPSPSVSSETGCDMPTRFDRNAASSMTWFPIRIDPARLALNQHRPEVFNWRPAGHPCIDKIMRLSKEDNRIFSRTQTLSHPE